MLNIPISSFYFGDVFLQAKISIHDFFFLIWSPCVLLCVNKHRYIYNHLKFRVTFPWDR